MNRSGIKSLVALLLLFISTSAFAEVTPGEMFTARSDDLSLNFLRMIFGSVGLALKGTNNQLVGEIFRIFNTGILVIVGGLIGYTALMTVISTSQDANQAFQNKVSPWAVFRIVSGSALLIPQFNGFSGIQVIVMTVVVQGVGFANYAWDNALNYLRDSGGAVYVSEQSNKKEDMTTLVKSDGLAPKMMKSALCLSTVQALYKNYLKQCNITRPVVTPDDFSMYVKGNELHYGLNKNIDLSVGDFGSCGVSFAESFNANFESTELNSICGTFSIPEKVDSKSSDYYRIATQQAAADSIGIMNAEFRRLERNTSINLKKSQSLIELSTDLITDVKESCANQSKCMMAHYFVALASDYYALSRPARVIPSSDKNKFSWIEDAKAQGWIMAATHYKNLVGGANVQKQSDLNELTVPENSEGSLQKIDILNDTELKDIVEKIGDYDAKVQTAYTPPILVYYALNSTLKENERNTNDIAEVSKTIVSELSQAEEKMFDNTSEVAASSSYEQKATQLFKNLEKVKFDSLNNLTPMGTSDHKSFIANVKLDFGSKNLQTAVMMVVQEMFGFDYKKIKDKKSFIKGGDDGNCKPFIGGTFNAKTAMAQGSASGNGCIVMGKGVLGGLLLEHNNQTYDPIQGAAELGRTMILAATMYWSATFEQLYKTTIEMAWASFGIQAAVATASGLLQAGLSLGGYTAAAAVNVPANIGIQAIRVLFELDKAAMEMFLPLGSAMATLLFGTGVVLGIYIPFMPFLLFLFGAIGWIIAVIEAMIAAPLVAMGVTHPEGHDLLGKAEQSLMLLLGVFIRPITMIIGLFFAIILANVAMKMLNMGFMYAFSDFFSTIGQVYKNMDATRIKGFMFGLSSIGLFMVYAYVVLAVLDQVFSLIWQVPDRILRWIGGPQDQSGTANMMRNIRGSTEQSSQSMGQGAGQATQGTSISGPQVQSGSKSKGPQESSGTGKVE